MGKAPFSSTALICCELSSLIQFIVLAPWQKPPALLSDPHARAREVRFQATATSTRADSGTASFASTADSLQRADSSTTASTRLTSFWVL